MDKKRFVYTGKGIYSQSRSPYPIGTVAAFFTPYEVGEYSIYVRENLDNLYQVSIYNNINKEYRSREILPTSEGSIVYFDKKLHGICAGYTYRGWKQRYIPYQIDDTLSQLYMAGIISLDTFLETCNNIYKKEQNEQSK